MKRDSFYDKLSSAYFEALDNTYEDWKGLDFDSDAFKSLCGGIDFILWRKYGGDIAEERFFKYCKSIRKSVFTKLNQAELYYVLGKYGDDTEMVGQFVGTVGEMRQALKKNNMPNSPLSFKSYGENFIVQQVVEIDGKPSLCVHPSL